MDRQRPAEQEEAQDLRGHRGYQAIQIQKDEEAALLEDVYSRLQRVYIKGKAPKARPLGLWFALPSLGVAGIALLIFLTTSADPFAPLVLSGALQTKRTVTPLQNKALPALELATPVGQEGLIRDGDRSEIRLRSNTRASLHRKASRKASSPSLWLRLHEGRLETQVKPGSYTSFEVHYQGAAVIVRGTRFVVESQGSRFFVSVQEGRVFVRSPKAREEQGRMLMKGEEAWFSIPSHVSSLSAPTRHPASQSKPSLPASPSSAQPLPEVATIAPSKALDTLRMTAKSAPHRFPTQLKAIASRADIALQQRGEWLDQLAEEFLRQGQKALAMQSFLALADLAIPDGVSAGALLQAALLCEERKEPMASCLALYKRYIDHSPQGVGYQEALFKYARALHRTDPAGAHSWLLLFLKRYPHSPHASRLRSLLQPSVPSTP